MWNRWLIGGLLAVLVFFISVEVWAAEDKSEELLMAVRNGDGQRVEELLDIGVRVETQDNFGKTPIIIASSRGDISLVQLLLARGANINAQDNWQRTPLIVAVQAQSTWLTDILIHHGADVNRQASNKITALIAATQRGNTAAVNMLIDGGAMVNHKDSMGWTSLMWASGRGNTELVTLLIDDGADVNAVNLRGMTVLDQAEERSYSQEITELLRSRGALKSTTTQIEILSETSLNHKAQKGKVFNPLTIDCASQGNKNAPVTIVEYTDFQCPYCSTGAKVMEDVLKKYNGSVRLVLKHNPLDFHLFALPASLYFEAIARQDIEKAWLFYQRIFEMQDRLQEGNLFLRQVAVELGIDMQGLDDALSSPELKSRVMADIREANSFGIDGVPAFIINGKLLEGALELEDFSNLIDEVLAKPIK